MADLTSKARKALPSSKFGLPSQRKYPLPDASHAQNAKARASQEYRAGKLTKSEKDEIFSKANKVLHKEH